MSHDTQTIFVKLREMLARASPFMLSSYFDCNHLLELSAQPAVFTAGRYGDEIDPYEIAIYNDDVA